MVTIRFISEMITKWFVSGESMPDSGVVVIKWLKISYNPNGREALKLVTVLKKTRLRMNISWIIDLPEVVVSFLSKFRHTNRTLFFDCEGDFPTQSCEISAHWNAPFLQTFLGYTPFIALKPSQILWSANLSYNCSWRLNWIWQDFPFALHKTFHAIRYETKFCVGI